jgi:hypothetical protein
MQPLRALLAQQRLPNNASMPLSMSAMASSNPTLNNIQPDAPPVVPASADDLVLTEEEIDLAIASFKAEKWQQLRNAAYRWHLNNPAPAPVVTAEELYSRKLQEARDSIPGFQLTAHNQAIFNLLCLYFTNDPRFEAKGEELGYNYSLTKGLLLFGPVGCGKTTLMRLFARNPRQPFGVLAARHVATRFSEQGPVGLEVYFEAASTGVCFDDLGNEAMPVKHYGNETNALSDVLLARYDEFQSGRLPGTMTHLTTNLPTMSEQQVDGTFSLSMDQCYGNRVRSRMRELLNPIYFPLDSSDLRS